MNHLSCLRQSHKWEQRKPPSAGCTCCHAGRIACVCEGGNLSSLLLVPEAQSPLPPVSCPTWEGKAEGVNSKALASRFNLKPCISKIQIGHKVVFVIFILLEPEGNLVWLQNIFNWEGKRSNYQIYVAPGHQKWLPGSRSRSELELQLPVLRTNSAWSHSVFRHRFSAYKCFPERLAMDWNTWVFPFLLFSHVHTSLKQPSELCGFWAQEPPQGEKGRKGVSTVRPSQAHASARDSQHLKAQPTWSREDRTPRPTIILAGRYKEVTSRSMDKMPADRQKSIIHSAKEIMEDSWRRYYLTQAWKDEEITDTLMEMRIRSRVEDREGQETSHYIQDVVMLLGQIHHVLHGVTEAFETSMFVTVPGIMQCLETESQWVPGARVTTCPAENSTI